MSRPLCRLFCVYFSGRRQIIMGMQHVITQGRKVGCHCNCCAYCVEISHDDDDAQKPSPKICHRLVPGSFSFVEPFEREVLAIFGPMAPLKGSFGSLPGEEGRNREMQLPITLGSPFSGHRSRRKRGRLQPPSHVKEKKESFSFIPDNELAIFLPFCTIMHTRGRDTFLNKGISSKPHENIL